MIKIATWNVNSIKVRLPHVLDWLERQRPDILALQEIKIPNDRFPKAKIEAAGYNVIYSGQKTYNGVALISKKTPKDIITDLPKMNDPQRRVLVATIDNFRVLNLYVPNGEAVGADKYFYKLEWLEKLLLFVKQQLKNHSKFIVLGDFNIAPEDRDVYDPSLWEGRILVSEPEREALKKLLKLGFHDAFRLFDQPEKNFSFWDYRLNAFRRNMGLRLDLILISNALVKHCKRCIIDKIPRGLERPSDHTPVIIYLEDAL